MKRYLRKRWRLILGVVLWVALIVAILITWEGVRDDLIQAGLLFPVTVVLVVLALISGAMGWALLQPGRARRRALVGFLAAQPAKYLPAGGAFQALGQVGLSSSDEADRSTVGWSFLVHIGVEVVAGSLLSLLLLAGPDIETWLNALLILLAVTGVVILRPAVIAPVTRMLTRLIPRLPPVEKLPNTVTLWLSCGWTIGALALSGSAFVALLGQWNDPIEGLATLGAFALAWLVGFVIFPLPSGLGAREVALIALLPHLPPGQVLGASIIHRFASIVAEMIVLSIVSRQAFIQKQKSDQ